MPVAGRRLSKERFIDRGGPADIHGSAKAARILEENWGLWRRQ